MLGFLVRQELGPSQPVTARTNLCDWLRESETLDPIHFHVFALYTCACFPLETGWDKGLGLRQLRANRLWRNMKERVVWFVLRFLAATAFVLTQGTKQKGVGALAAAVGVIPGELLQLMIDSGSFWKSLNKSKHALILLQGAVYRFCASTTAIAEWSNPDSLGPSMRPIVCW